MNVKTEWHQYYSHSSRSFSKYYIPENLFYSIIEPQLNKFAYAGSLSDKNLLSRWFKDMELPDSVIRNVNGVYFDSDDLPITKLEAYHILKKQNSKLVIKPTINSFGGKNVLVFEINQYGMTDYKDKPIDELITLYKKNFTVQKFIKQHEVLSQLNSTSVNTLRIMTLFTEDKIHICNTRLRFGVLGSKIDNTSNGGLTCVIKPDGTLGSKVYDGHGKLVDSISYKLNKIIIPNYEILIEELKKSHLAMPFFKLISWDIAINEQGKPVIVEFNVIGQGINSLQVTGYPLFGIYTENVLKQIVQ